MLPMRPGILFVKQGFFSAIRRIEKYNKISDNEAEHIFLFLIDSGKIVLHGKCGILKEIDCYKIESLLFL